MKKILVIIFVVFAFRGYSQDYLILKDGTERAVVVQDISLDAIRYQYYGSKTRAVYTIYKSDVKMVVYENGEEEVFTTNRRPKSENDYINTYRKRERNKMSYPAAYERSSRYGDDDVWSESKSYFLIGVRGGFGIANISGVSKLFEMSGTGYSSSSLLGFHSGLVAQFNFPGNWFFQPELLYSSQGCEIEGEAGVLGYIQLPLQTGYKIDVGNDFDLLFGTGIYFAFGVYGRDDAFEYTFRRFDFGLPVFFGFQVRGTMVTVGYDFGLVDIVGIDGWHEAQELDKSLPKICNRNFKFSVVQFF